MFLFLDTSDTHDDEKFSHFQTSFKAPKEGENVGFNFNVYRNGNFNKGFYKRKELKKNSQKVYFYLLLRRLFGFLKDNDKVFTGLVHEVELKRNNDRTFIHSAGSQFEFKLTDSSWFVPVLEPSLSVCVELTEMFAKGLKSKFYWKNTTTIISKKEDDKRSTWRVTALQHKRLSVYIGFQRHGRIERESARKHSNMIFDDLQVKDIQVTLGNKTLPKNNDRIVKTYLGRVYMSFLSAGIKDEKCDIGTHLDYNTFKKLYQMFHFDFTHSDKDDFTRGSKDFNIYCEIGYEGDYNIICIIETERESQIQMRYRKV